MTTPKQVLIIEDTQDIATFMVLALQDMKLDVHHMNTPEKAIKFLEGNQPALIILDIGLPGMTGWQLLDLLKDRREKEGIFIVVTTAYTDPANRVVGKLQHVDHYLNKPFPLDELRRVVGGLLKL